MMPDRSREGRFEPGICTRNGMTQWHPTQTNTLNGVWQVIPIETYRPSNLYLSLRDIYHRRLERQGVTTISS